MRVVTEMIDCILQVLRLILIFLHTINHVRTFDIGTYILLYKFHLITIETNLNDVFFQLSSMYKVCFFYSLNSHLVIFPFFLHTQI